MQKEFNVTGTCIPKRHYMVDTADKLEKVMQLVEKGKYFTINRPRQYGKTTTLSRLNKLLEKEGYLPVKISFEGLEDEVWETAQRFCKEFAGMLMDKFLVTGQNDAATYWTQCRNRINSLNEFSRAITSFVLKQPQKVVLMIDEVDQTSNVFNYARVLRLLWTKEIRRTARITSNQGTYKL